MKENKLKQKYQRDKIMFKMRFKKQPNHESYINQHELNQILLIW